MLNNETIESVKSYLNDQNFMQNVFYQISSYDKIIGISFDGNYSISPDLIYPIETEDENLHSIITFFVERENKLSNKYTMFFQIYEGKYQVRVLYPGEGNADYFLFNDIYPIVSSMTGDDAFLKDTKIVNKYETGWTEEWVFINEDGEVTKRIDFSTAPDGSTVWNIK